LQLGSRDRSYPALKISLGSSLEHALSSPWITPEPEPGNKGVFDSENFSAAISSIALPGSGHLIRGRRTAGLIWLFLSVVFYAALLLFRVAAMVNVFLLAGIAAIVMSCVAAYDCCLRGSQDLWPRKFGFLVLVVLGSLIWGSGARYAVRYLSGLIYSQASSEAMSPTIENLDSVLVDMRYYQHHRPEEGDIVLVYHRFPSSPNSILMIKRLIGLPGDTVEVSNGKVVRNGTPLEEKYARYLPSPPYLDWVRTMPTRTVPPSKLFLLGDNRDLSLDSRSPDVGYYDESELRGKVIAVVHWPW